MVDYKKNCAKFKERDEKAILTTSLKEKLKREKMKCYKYNYNLDPAVQNYNCFESYI